VTQTGTTASLLIDSVCVHVTFEQREPNVWIVAFDVEEHEIEQAFTLALHLFDGVMLAVREFIERGDPATIVFPDIQQKGLADAYEVYLLREENHLARLGYNVEVPDRIGRLTELRLRRMGV
jgi:hypothetical protein